MRPRGGMRARGTRPATPPLARTRQERGDAAMARLAGEAAFITGADAGIGRCAAEPRPPQAPEAGQTP